MSRNENRLNFRMTDETAAKIERWYQEDNCRSKNEFIEKAVNCYADMLAAGESTTLPRAVQSAIDVRLKLFEDCIAALLYKQAVEMDMAMSILLQSLNVSEEVLRQERAKSIAAVKRTNGQLRLEQKLRELESEAWQGWSSRVRTSSAAVGKALAGISSTSRRGSGWRSSRMTVHPPKSRRSSSQNWWRIFLTQKS